MAHLQIMFECFAAEGVQKQPHSWAYLWMVCAAGAPTRQMLTGR